MRPKLIHVNSASASWNFFVGQLRYMGMRGFEVHAVSSDGPELRRLSSEEGVVTHVVPITRTITPLRDLQSVALLWRLFRVLRPEIVVGHTSKVGPVSMLASSLAGVPVRIYHNHGLSALSAHGYMRALLGSTERFSCRLATRTMFVSESVRAAALENGFCSSDRAGWIASINGLDTMNRFDRRLWAQSRSAVRRALGIPDGAPVLGFVGRVFVVKGIVELIEAWSKLSRQFPLLHLLIVGGLDDRVPLPDRTLRAIRSDVRIHHIGYVAEPAPYYAAIDVLAAPSHYEGLGYALLEAAAMEVPIVATRIPGHTDATRDGVNASLVPVRNVAALVRAIAQYVRDDDLRRRHGAAGRRFIVETFQQEMVWDRTYRSYVDLLVAHDERTPVRDRW